MGYCNSCRNHRRSRKSHRKSHCKSHCKKVKCLKVDGNICVKGSVITKPKLCPPRPKIPPQPEILTVNTSGVVPVSPKVLPATISYYAQGNPLNPIAFCWVGALDVPDSWRWIMPELVARGFYAVAPFNRGNFPTSVANPLDLPTPGTAAAYWIGDMVELLLSLGIVDPSRVGKNIFLTSDFGAILMPLVEFTLNGIAGQNVFKIGVSSGNIPPPAVLRDQVAVNPSFDQQVASWYIYLQNISPLLSDPTAASLFIVDLANLRVGPPAGPSWTTSFITKLLSPTQNVADRAADIGRTVTSIYTVPTDFLQLVVLYRDLFATVSPLVPHSVKVLYVYSPFDGALPLFSDQTLGQLTVLTLDPVNSPAGAKVLFIPCAGHFQNREDVEKFNDGVLDFVDSNC